MGRESRIVSHGLSLKVGWESIHSTTFLLPYLFSDSFKTTELCSFAVDETIALSLVASVNLTDFPRPDTAK